MTGDYETQTNCSISHPRRNRIRKLKLIRDNVHPSYAGAKAIGQQYAAVTAAYYNFTGWIPFTNSGPQNLINDALFEDSVQNIQALWSNSNGVLAPTLALAPDDSTLGSNQLQISFPSSTASGQTYTWGYKTITVNNQADQKYALVFRVTTQGLEANGGWLSVSTGQGNVAYSEFADLSNGWFYVTFLVAGSNSAHRATTTTLAPSITYHSGANGGAVTVGLAQFGLVAIP